MSRPSQNLDKVLIQVAKEMMAEGGITDLSIRQVCSRANVNPGMFKYLFSNRANFLRIVHQELYDEFFAFLQEAADRETDSLQKLRSCLIKMAECCRDQRPLFAAFLRDHINGKLDEIIPPEHMVPKDLLLILQLITECKKAGYFPQQVAEIQIAATLLTSTILPILAEVELKAMASMHLPPQLSIDLASESACVERIDIVLKGLRL